jgi:hypothetical protein
LLLALKLVNLRWVYKRLELINAKQNLLISIQIDLNTDRLKLIFHKDGSDFSNCLIELQHPLPASARLRSLGNFWPMNMNTITNGIFCYITGDISFFK